MMFIDSFLSDLNISINNVNEILVTSFPDQGKCSKADLSIKIILNNNKIIKYGSSLKSSSTISSVQSNSLESFIRILKLHKIEVKDNIKQFFSYYLFYNTKIDTLKLANKISRSSLRRCRLTPSEIFNNNLANKEDVFSFLSENAFKIAEIILSLGNDNKRVADILGFTIFNESKTNFIYKKFYNIKDLLEKYKSLAVENNSFVVFNRTGIKLLNGLVSFDMKGSSSKKNYLFKKTSAYHGIQFKHASYKKIKKDLKENNEKI